MKCPYFYRTVEVLSKKGNKSKRVYQEDQATKDNVACDGKIIATVNVVDEPYYGGTSGVLEIEYVCNKCGKSVFHVDFPDSSYDLSDMLTKFVEKL